MPKIPYVHESLPAPIVGYLDPASLSGETMRHSGFFTIRTRDGELDESVKSVADDSVIADLEPMWSAVSADFCELHDLGPGVRLEHSFRVENDEEFTPFSEEVSGRPHDPRRTTIRAGLPHLDVEEVGFTNSRYITHTTAPTEFFWGKWFLPYRAKDTGTYLEVTRVALGSLLNGAFIYAQMPFAVPFQPEPGMVTRIDRQIHRSSRRHSAGANAGKLIIDDVSVV